MATLGFWRKLWLRITGQSKRVLLLAAPQNSEDDGPPADNPIEDAVAILSPVSSAKSTHENWLDQLVRAASEGRRHDELGKPVFWKNIDTLWSQGDELLASQWLEKFLVLPDLGDKLATEIRVRLVELFDERGDLSPVLQHIDALCEVPRQAAQAHYYLAEHYRRRGDEVLTMREYEAVLAIDVDYPNVQQRYQRLKAARGGNALASAGETIVGASSASTGDRYLLVRELGRGAAGVVYLARDMQLEREVAVKLLHPHVAAAKQKKALQAFFDEARVAASLRHPNIVGILDLDQKARRIVMELCDGGTLRSVLRDSGPRPLRRALERHSQILSALDAAHARGVIHRDLKPANLMFRREPDLPGTEVVLGDFGIAHLPDAKGKTGQERAKNEQAVGTIAYMAPEQRRGEVTTKSDLYASAVVLFEMLTGRYPWSREQLLAGVRRPGDFALPKSLHEAQPKLGALLQVHLDALGAPAADNRPDTTAAMKASRRLRDLAIVCCKDGDPILQ